MILLSSIPFGKFPVLGNFSSFRFQKVFQFGKAERLQRYKNYLKQKTIWAEIFIPAHTFLSQMLRLSYKLACCSVATLGILRNRLHLVTIL